MIALSFDVEPDFPPHYKTFKGVEGLEKINSILREHKSDATFFVCAELLDSNPEIIEYMKDFEVGCHGLRHIDLTKLTEMQLEGEILEAVESFEEHELKPRGFRAPYARINETVFKVLSKYFEYDSSLMFYQKKPENLEIKEIPIFNGGKLFGIKPSLFRKTLSLPVENKVYFVHPWEYGGIDFKLIEKKRKKMKALGYKKENYVKNLETILKEKPVRISHLL